MSHFSQRLLLVVSTIAIAIDASAQCTKDMDCKGDRVCVKGTCVDPSTKPPGAPTPAQTLANTDCRLESPESASMMVMRASGQLIPMTYVIPRVDTTTGGLAGNAFSFGIAKVKSKALLRIDREHAILRIHDRQPQFVDALAPVGASADLAYLVRLTSKDNARYFQIGSSEANAFGGSSSSLVLPEGVRVDMAAETVSPQCTFEGKKVTHYRLRPAKPLEDGEYAFWGQ